MDIRPCLLRGAPAAEHAARQAGMRCCWQGSTPRHAALLIRPRGGQTQRSPAGSCPPAGCCRGCRLRACVAVGSKGRPGLTHTTKRWAAQASGRAALRNAWVLTAGNASATSAAQQGGERPGVQMRTRYFSSRKQSGDGPPAGVQDLSRRVNGQAPHAVVRHGGHPCPVQRLQDRAGRGVPMNMQRP